MEHTTMMTPHMWAMVIFMGVMIVAAVMAGFKELWGHVGAVVALTVIHVFIMALWPWLEDLGLVFGVYGIWVMWDTRNYPDPPNT